MKLKFIGMLTKQIFIAASLLTLSLPARSQETLPTCVEAISNARGRNPITKEVLTIPMGTAVPTVKLAASKKTFQVTYSDQNIWVDRNKLQEVSPERCAPANAEVTLPEFDFASDHSWHFGFEAGYVGGRSKDDFGNLITEVPDPSNVGALQNPIIQKVEKGSGFQAKAFAEKRIFDRMYTRAALGYRSVKFEYSGKSNPTVDPNPLSALEDFKSSLTLNSVLFNGAIRYPFSLTPKLRTWVSLGIDGQYYYEGQQKVKVLVGTVFKRTETEIATGPEGFQIDFVPRFDVEYQNIFLGLEATPKAEYGITLGYRF